MLVSGLKIKRLETPMSFTLMEVSTKGTSLNQYSMEKECSAGQQQEQRELVLIVINILVTGLKVKCKVKECLSMLLEDTH